MDDVFGSIDATLFSQFAEAATYTPPGGSPVAVTAVPHRDLQSNPSGFEGFAVEPQTEISLLYSEVPDPKRGGTIVIGSDTYQIDRPVANDRRLVRVVVR